MEFLKKCTDSVTETKHQAVYDILVFKYVNIFAGQPLRYEAQKSDIAYLHDVHIHCSQQHNFQTNGNCMALKECYSNQQHPEENYCFWLSSYKRN